MTHFFRGPILRAEQQRFRTIVLPSRVGLSADERFGDI